MSAQLLNLPQCVSSEPSCCRLHSAMSLGECADHHRLSPRSGFTSESYGSAGQFVRTVQALSSSLGFQDEDIAQSHTSDSNSHHSIIIEPSPSPSSPLPPSSPHTLVVVGNDAACLSPDRQADCTSETSPAHSSHSSDGTATGCEPTRNSSTTDFSRATLALQSSLGIPVPSRFAGTPASQQLANQDSPPQESRTPVPERKDLISREDSDTTTVGGAPGLIADYDSVDEDSAVDRHSFEGVQIEVQSSERDVFDQLLDQALQPQQDASTGSLPGVTQFNLGPAMRRSSLQLLRTSYDVRKLSDPSARLRKESVHSLKVLRKQRCLSDSEAPSFTSQQMEEDEFRSEEGGSSALGYDSGFNDERSSRFQESIGTWSHNSQAVSDSESHDLPSLPHKTRKVTPLSLSLSKEVGGGEDPAPRNSTSSQRRRLFSKYSASSLGGTSSIASTSESVISSLLEPQSPVTATSILSSLGFDDYAAPQLIPDRFIPRDLEHIKPSVMRNSISTTSSQQQPPLSPDSVTSASSVPSSIPQRQTSFDLPLGATAENFLHRAPSPPLPSTKTPTVDSTEVDCTEIYTNPAIVQFAPGRGRLETVPEETASDLSPSPRWLSPRVSVDHSVFDVAEGKLGASLNIQKPRKRSLPQREGYKVSIGSQVESETGDSIYFSVTSYDDELVAEREKEREELGGGLSLPEDCGFPRRRRRGVYVPPPGLLTWINSQNNTINEEDLASTNPDELPWPFNEEAHLRKSLTEMHLAQEGLLEQVQQAQESSCNEQTSAGGGERGGEEEEEEDLVGMELSRSPSPGGRYSLCDLEEEEEEEEEDRLSDLGSLLDDDPLSESCQPDANWSHMTSHDSPDVQRSPHQADSSPQFGRAVCGDSPKFGRAVCGDSPKFGRAVGGDSPRHSPAMGVRRTRPITIHDPPPPSSPSPQQQRKHGNVWCREVAAVQRNEAPVMGHRRARTPVHAMGRRHGRLQSSLSRESDRGLNDTSDLFDPVTEETS